MFDHKRNDTWVSTALIAVACCFSVLVAGIAYAGAGAPTVRAPYDFDQTGTSDVLLMKVNTPPNVGINQTNTVSGTSFATRGWPDLNTSASGVEYTTRGAGVFDDNANEQAQILTRKTAGSNIGLVRIVKLLTTGIGRAVPGQFFVGGTDSDWTFLGVGDCNGDGADDIVYYNTSGGASDGMIRIVFMNPVADSFTVISTQHPGALGATNQPVGVGDADGDGQADIWTLDTNTQGIEVLINAPDVDTGGAFESGQMPTVLPANYSVFGVGIFNPADVQADIVFEKTGAPNVGLVRIDHTGTGGGSSGAAPVAFPVLLDQTIGEVLAALGDYDDMNQQDLLTRMLTPSNNANDGALTVRLIDAAGTATTASGSPANWSNPLSYDVIDGAPQ